MGQGWETKTPMARSGGAEVRCLGTGTPALAFSKGACPAPFQLFALEVSSHPGRPTPRPCLRLQTGQELLIWTPGVPHASPPKCEIPKACSLGAKNSTPPPPRPPPIPYLTPLSLHHPPLSVCVFRAPGPCASGHYTARAERGKAATAVRETGPGANTLSLPQS